MKTFREIAGTLHNNPLLRETVEWSNTWYDKADTEDKSQKRLLFIGDCVLRAVRGSISEKLNTPIDLFGSSASMNDELFAEQIDSFFKNIDYKYDAIVMQQGHHGNEVMGKMIGEKELAQFADSLKNITDFLRQYSDKIVIMTILTRIIETKKKKGITKFLYRTGIKKEVGDPVFNKVEFAKNDIIRQFAKDNNIVLCDLAAELTKTKFLRIDHVHYEEKAYKFISDVVLKSII